MDSELNFLPLSIYCHIPFCRHRCAYCDFNTYTGLTELKEAYVAALGQEMVQVGVSRPVHTLFFGGGTPSLIAPAGYSHLLTTIRHQFQLSPTAEITMEANPGTVDLAYLQQIRQLGFNRLSFGLQSANQSELALLEREHSFETVIEAMAMARQAGFDNINLDLIYGLPDQSLATWQASLEAALSLKPDHLSLYCLAIEPGTPMERWLKNGRISPPDPDLAAEQYELACQLLDERAFVHYEISNWALPGRECQHNLTYWRNQEYLGLGAGAHGQAAGYRYAVVKQPRVYIRRLSGRDTAHYPLSTAVAHKQLTGRQEAITDTLITQLRLLQEGLNLTQFANRFGQKLTDLYGDTLNQLFEWGLLEQTGEQLLLSRPGWFLSNQVFYRFL